MAASLLALAGAGGLVGLAMKDQEGLVSSPAEQRCIVPRRTGRVVFGVEEVNAAGVQPQALPSGLVLSDAPEKPKFKEHPASTRLLPGGKCSRGVQLWAGAKLVRRSPRSAVPGGPCWLPARAALPKLNAGLLRLFMSCQLAARSNLILAERCYRGAAWAPVLLSR